MRQMHHDKGMERIERIAIRIMDSRGCGRTGPIFAITEHQNDHHAEALQLPGGPVPAGSIGQWLDSAMRYYLSHLSNDRHRARNLLA